MAQALDEALSKEYPGEGVEIIESADYDLSSPNDVELEIMGYEEIKGDK